MRSELSIGELADLLDGEGRILVGIAGEPGAGKSTLVAELAQELRARGRRVAVVPMDGFHLADSTLHALGRLERKGAIDTFDAHGFVHLVERLRRQCAETVYLPIFERELEEPIAGAIGVDPDDDIVLIEGNYLFDRRDPWNRVKGLLHHAWFLDLDPGLRRCRLVTRHMEFGKPQEAAYDWVQEVDEANATRIRRSAERADRIVVLREGPRNG